MDLHQKEIQGFFTFPVDNLRASPFLIQYIQEEVMTDSECIQDPCSFAPIRVDVTHIYEPVSGVVGTPSPNHTGQIYVTHSTSLRPSTAHNREPVDAV